MLEKKREIGNFSFRFADNYRISVIYLDIKDIKDQDGRAILEFITIRLRIAALLHQIRLD